MESFEMLCGRRMEKILWNHRLRNEGALQRAKERGIYYKQ